jgi:hypothetical protein
MYLTMVARRNRFMGFADLKVTENTMSRNPENPPPPTWRGAKLVQKSTMNGESELVFHCVMPVMMATALVNMARRFARQLFVSLDLVPIPIAGVQPAPNVAAQCPHFHQMRCAGKYTRSTRIHRVTHGRCLR